MAGHQPESPKNSRSFTYYITGCALLAFMGLVWALDSSLVYLSLAAAAFFFFLGWYNMPRAAERVYKPPRRDRTKGTQDFDELLKEFTSPKDAPRPGKTQSKPLPIAKIIAVIFVVAFFSIFGFIFILIFSDDSSYENIYSSFDIAEQYRESGQYDSAVVYYKKALEEDPKNAEAMAGYGYVFFNQEKNDDALRYFNQALEISPDIDLARYGRGQVYYAKKNYNQALQEAQSLLTMNPQYTNANLLAGDCFYIQNRYDSAIRYYEVAYESGIRSADLCHIMAYIYDTKNMTDKSIPLYQETLNYDSTRVGVYTRLSELISGPNGQWYAAQARRWKEQGYTE